MICGLSREEMQQPRVLAFLSMLRTMIKSSLGVGWGRGFIWLTLPGHNPLLQELKKDLKQKL